MGNIRPPIQDLLSIKSMKTLACLDNKLVYVLKYCELPNYEILYTENNLV